MIIFRNIKIENYRNIKNTGLKDLKDLNIIIGPNNCGKTNILELISSMSNINCGRGQGYLCPNCKKFAEEDKEIAGIALNLRFEDFYLKKDTKKTKVCLTMLFNEDKISKLIPNVLEYQKEKIDKTTVSCQSIADNIILESDDSTTLLGKHFSVFIHKAIIDKLKSFILYCPEGRLQSYKDKNFGGFLREKIKTGTERRRLIDFIGKFVDPKIQDYTVDEDLIRKVEDENFQTSIKDQGSGVRSLICLVADILSKKDARIILIDEPELGLNPFAKQEFLKFLRDESKTRQIFLATQDTTFVNPILWENERIAVYLYSILYDKFVEINLTESNEDPNIFAGYLPHTVSLKDSHIYVEGSGDAYIFQIFLEKYLKQKFKDKWWVLYNRIGIYHLAGGFWMHLLYTIPKHPYKCIVILDGDKRNEAKEVCDKYNASLINTSKFRFCQKLEEVEHFFGTENPPYYIDKLTAEHQKETIKYFGPAHPVYCLSQTCIEKYFEPKFNCRSPPKSYDKRINGVTNAENMKQIPDEIEQLFDIIAGSL